MVLAHSLVLTEGGATDRHILGIIIDHDHSKFDTDTIIQVSLQRIEMSTSSHYVVEILRASGPPTENDVLR